MAIPHSQLSGSSLHNPKGIDSENSSTILFFSQSISAVTASGNMLVQGNIEYTGTLTGTIVSANTASYLDFSNIDNTPALLSSSAQIASDISGSITEFSSSVSTRFDSLSSNFNELTDNPFTQSLSAVSSSKSIVPVGNNLDLGSLNKPWRDLYLSSASLYVNGVQVISSDSNEILFETDTAQSIRILEAGADTITLQSEDGDIALTTTGTGNIELNAPVQVEAGNQLLSSDGNDIQFGNGLDVTGNITVSGNVDGVNIANLKSSFDTLEGKTLLSGSSQVDIANTTNNTTDNITEGSNLYYTDARVKTKLNSEGVISGSVIAGDRTFSNNITVGGDLTVQGTTTSIDSTTVNIGDNIISLNGSGATNGGIEVNDGPASGSFIWDGTLNYWKAGAKGSESEIITTSNVVENLPSGTVSGSVQIDIASTTNNTTDNITEASNLYYTDDRVLSKINTEGVLSSSAQIASDISGSITEFSSSVALRFDGLTSDYTELTNIPVGIVSSSAQIASDISGSFTSTSASLASAIEGITGFPFTGSAEISGSLTVDGTTTVTELVETSAMELKDNIQTLNSQLHNIAKLNPVQFTWKNQGDVNYGFIAEEVSKIYPELTNKDRSGIQYSKMVSVLSKGIQDLYEIIKTQEERIKQLESK